MVEAVLAQRGFPQTIDQENLQDRTYLFKGVIVSRISRGSLNDRDMSITFRLAYRTTMGKIAKIRVLATEDVSVTIRRNFKENQGVYVLGNPTRVLGKINNDGSRKTRPGIKVLEIYPAKPQLR